MAESAQDLIAKKQYGKAVELLQKHLKARPKDQRLRLQLADTLVLANRGKDAAPILMGLADEHAQDGFAAKAIAILKRIEKVSPGRRDVEERLAHLIREKTRAADSSAPTRGGAEPAFGLEEFDPSADPLARGPELGMAAGPDLGIEAATPLRLEPEPEILPTVAADSDEDLAYLAAAEEESASAKGGDAMFSTPLFQGFSEQDLAAVIHGLELLTFEPGDVLVAEGAPGDSLFILSTGSVKAFVRNPSGHYTKVHTLVEGDFFGEISALTGKPRTATLVAASYCEVLELKKKNLDEITATHPQVREVLKKFHEDRARSTIEAMMRKKGK
ncbi:MAG TPA: cyclic nucleotide-binding domain-containing protein [Vicinamibacteria bacterium]|nr:cyclic nucleotide-binding domain-containing protein [Vicinamibacteria bacterium]